MWPFATCTVAGCVISQQLLYPLSVCRYESTNNHYSVIHLYMSSRLPALSVCRYELPYDLYSCICPLIYLHCLCAGLSQCATCIHLYTCIYPLVYLHCLCAGMSRRTTNTVGWYTCIPVYVLSSTCIVCVQVWVNVRPIQWVDITAYLQHAAGGRGRIFMQSLQHGRRDDHFSIPTSARCVQLTPATTTTATTTTPV